MARRKEPQISKPGVLYLHPMKVDIGTGSCLSSDCNRKGRYVPFLAGRKCEGDYGPEVLCSRCAKEWRRVFGELVQEGELVKAFEALRGTPLERVDAIDYLRGIGFDRDLIAQTLKASAERVALERILEVLAGEVRGAVAA